MMGVILMGSLVLLGCSQKAETASDANANGAAANAGPHQTPAVVQPVAIPEGTAADSSAVLAALTQAVRKYSFEHRVMPKSFAEVVAAGYIKNVPPAPAGQRYEIDAKQSLVILVKQ